MQQWYQWRTFSGARACSPPLAHTFFWEPCDLKTVLWKKQSLFTNWIKHTYKIYITDYNNKGGTAFGLSVCLRSHFLNKWPWFCACIKVIGILGQRRWFYGSVWPLSMLYTAFDPPCDLPYFPDLPFPFPQPLCPLCLISSPLVSFLSSTFHPPFPISSPLNPFPQPYVRFLSPPSTSSPSPIYLPPQSHWIPPPFLRWPLRSREGEGIQGEGNAEAELRKPIKGGGRRRGGRKGKGGQGCITLLKSLLCTWMNS